MIARGALRYHFNETNENYASGRYAIKLCSLTLIRLGSTCNLGEVSMACPFVSWYERPVTYLLSILCCAIIIKWGVLFVTSLLPDGTHFDKPLPLCVYFLSSVHCSFIFSKYQKVGTTYGRKMMTGYIRHATGLRLGVNSVGRALKRVNPQQHRERQASITRHINPVPCWTRSLCVMASSMW